jgi:hypothetical protein
VPIQLTDYRVGKSTKHGVPVQRRCYPNVVAVPSHEIEKAVGLRGPRLREYLKECRTSGKLLCPIPKRLQGMVVQGESRRRMYLFIGPTVPRYRGRVSR